MKAIIQIDVPNYQIGQEVSIYFKDTMMIKGIVQEPKTGHWVMPVQDDGMSDPIYYQVRCSECGFDLDPQTWHQELHQYDADKFCPNCGCRMLKPQESED